MAGDKLPAEAVTAILRASQLPEENRNPVAGYDFNDGLDLDALLRSLVSTGFQAAHLGQAIVEVNRMVGVFACHPSVFFAATLRLKMVENSATL